MLALIRSYVMSNTDEQGKIPAQDLLAFVQRAGLEMKKVPKGAMRPPQPLPEETISPS